MADWIINLALETALKGLKDAAVAIVAKAVEKGANQVLESEPFRDFKANATKKLAAAATNLANQAGTFTEFTKSVEANDVITGANEIVNMLSAVNPTIRIAIAGTRMAMLLAEKSCAEEIVGAAETIAGASYDAAELETLKVGTAGAAGTIVGAPQDEEGLALAYKEDIESINRQIEEVECQVEDVAQLLKIHMGSKGGEAN